MIRRLLVAAVVSAGFCKGAKIASRGIAVLPEGKRRLRNRSAVAPKGGLAYVWRAFPRDCYWGTRKGIIWTHLFLLCWSIGRQVSASHAICPVGRSKGGAIALDSNDYDS